MSNPFIIAELSGNHNGKIEKALELLEQAKLAGADAVKLQTYTADTLTINHNSEDFIVKGGLWKGKSLYDLYQEAHTPWDWHPTLFEKGEELGIMVFSTPFDETAVDFLESLGCPLYKIASFEIVHHPLIAHVAKTGKPIIMSTGISTIEEIEQAVDIAFTNGCRDLTLLHCVSEYPASIENCNLAMISDLKRMFPQCKIGLSDHTLGVTVAIAAVALGASVIEKHVTLSRDDGGVDSAFSLEPLELKQLCEETKKAHISIGSINYVRSEKEKQNIIFRRSLYIVDNIKAGETLSRDNIRVIRPGYGMSPKFLSKVIGKKVNKDCNFGTPLHEDLIDYE